MTRTYRYRGTDYEVKLGPDSTEPGMDRDGYYWSIVNGDEAEPWVGPCLTVMAANAAAQRDIDSAIIAANGDRQYAAGIDRACGYSE